MISGIGDHDPGTGDHDQRNTHDPKNPRWRSCAIVFMQLGRYDRARDFTSLDAASEWFRTLQTGLLIREDRPEEALRFVRPDTSNPVIEWMRGCLEHRHRPDAARAPSPRGLEETQERTHDPENLYWIAGLFGYCGDRDAALRVLRRTVQGGYCAYPAMENDPLLAPVRGSSEYAAIRDAGIACQKRFLAARAR
jgi:hypothetical protein